MVRVFANGPGDLGSIPGRVIPKTQKMVLDAILLNTRHYKVLSRVRWSNPGKGVAPSPTLRCSSYRKVSLRVTLDYGRQLYFTFIYIYIYIYQNDRVRKWFEIWHLVLFFFIISYCYALHLFPSSSGGVWILVRYYMSFIVKVVLS